MIRELDWVRLYDDYSVSGPFNHIVIDNFFTPEVADKLSEEKRNQLRILKINYLLVVILIE